MRRNLLIVCGLLALGGITYRTAKRATISIIAHAQTTTAPFTMEQWTWDRNGHVTEQRTVGRRSDGSEVWVSIVPQQPQRGIMRRIEWADGAVVAIYDSIQAITTMHRTYQEMAWQKQLLLHPRPSCTFPSEKLLREETVLGYPVFVVSSERSNGMRWTEARSPQFACKPFYALIEQRQADGTYLKQVEAKALYLTPGEPDPRLFQHDNAYKEMKPSEAKAAAMRALGITEDKCPKCFDSNWNATADADYLNRRQPQ